MVKNPPANAGDIRDTDLIPGWRRSPGRENSNPLQYSRLENWKGRGAWQATVHGTAKSQTQPIRTQAKVIHGAWRCSIQCSPTTLTLALPDLLELACSCLELKGKMILIKGQRTKLLRYQISASMRKEKENENISYSYSRAHRRLCHVWSVDNYQESI